MSVNVEALIDSLGRTYQEIFDAGLIPYKTKPTGFSGDPDVSLDMVKEGVYLSFNRSDRVLNEITLTFFDDDKKSWIFPNELNLPLKKHMSRDYVHEFFGIPVKTSPPEIILKRQFGWIELYSLEGKYLPTSMQINYTLDEVVKTITFLLTSTVRW
ncbi:DUF6392 family protein [Pectobacterium brasiliense]|uniref:DUF6392 family protein n=1 Tax=Pectobacterium TaxID=122277 RepID=UPI00057F40DF|nr:DUF6392 family protein [Pectobacterium brasiliense]GKV77817.1 hypothetical protein PEC106568_29900 [Pectobacterium carotovorum subsp. carotovorum]APS29874.1 pyocin immunity protein [Pectobacterium brasiliense]KHS75402.1 pyocin immunity protein [Pectobacterium brasiliense]KHT08042.1 pyocin immunity protein [Pectobacterium brasiliense]KHT43259.1 pyocin immunity protein [Pectobacterium brasiliense]